MVQSVVSRSKDSTLKAIDRYFVHIALGAMALSIALGGTLIYMLSGLNEVPRWWSQREASVVPGDAQVIERAERLENAITTQLTAVRDPSDPRWAVAVSDEQANAWLAARLRETIETHMGQDAWSESIERVYIVLVGDQMTLGARVQHQTGSAIVSARVRLELDERGDLWARIGSVQIGRTRVPSWAIGLLGEGDLHIGRVRLGPGALELGDGRLARLVGVRTSDGRLEVVLETVRVAQQ